MATFVLELKLNTVNINDVLDTRFEIGRRMYNQILSIGIKNRQSLMESKEYQHLYRLYQNSTGDEKKQLSRRLSELCKRYHFSDYGLQSDIKYIQHNYKSHISSGMAQKIATRAWIALEKLHYGNGHNVHFKKYGGLHSLEEKSNASGCKYKDGIVTWNKLKIPVIVRNNDYYALEALERRVKYIRIIRKVIKNKFRYFVQLILEGLPPTKYDKLGNPRHARGKGRIGIDIGCSTIAIVSDKKALLQQLAPDIEQYNRKIIELSRKMDRSRRMTNPNNYTDKGEIKRGIRLKWIRSKNYHSLLMRLKDAYRKRSEYIKSSHRMLIYEILSLGDKIYVETMCFKGLAKRSKKKPEVNPNTGRFKRKKRFGKSLNNRAPALFLTKLNEKLSYDDNYLYPVDTFAFKASQYNHETDNFQKKALSNRWNTINNQQVQRDLYSAFLLKNSNADLKSTNRKMCLETYDQFKTHHDNCINRFDANKKYPTSFGL